ncbi:uncharacterized protein Dere_GG27171 [Drosophila erecta]|uniref:Uncharacterized protein n=1 Tax=Drosophila erecta TaxID=7220 RepID=A0A0Q5U6D1_DROER|nr:uncharacterized protein Dere_GG27171 [Drosophila erecta]
MKIALVHFCIITLVLLMCCFTVEATLGGTAKCKPHFKFAHKLKKCIKVRAKKKKIKKPVHWGIKASLEYPVNGA